MPNGQKPDREALGFILLALALVLAGVLVLYALTEPANRPDLLTRLGQAWPTAVLLVPAILAWLNGRAANDKADKAVVAAERVEEKVDQVAEHVNGRMAELIDKTDPPRTGGT